MQAVELALVVTLLFQESMRQSQFLSKDRLLVRLIGGLQLLVIAAYVSVLTLALPELWIDPFGPLLKVLPIAVATLVMIALETER